MPQWYEDFSRFGHLDKGGWKVQASGFHTASYNSNRLGKENILWLEGDLSGADKRVSRPFKSNISKSIAWAFLFKLDTADANNYIEFFPFVNEEDPDGSSASINGYSLIVIGDDTLTLRTVDGSDAYTEIHSPGWTADTEEHLIVISREVSGANRYWRSYLDPPITKLFDSGSLIDGPDNEATYSTANYMGIRYSATGRQLSTALYMQW